MTMYGFKDGLTEISQANMNNFFNLQPFVNIFEGAADDAKTGAGTTELENRSYNYAIRLTTTDGNMGRVEFEIVKHGDGADLELELRDATFDSSGSNDGVFLKSIKIPKEFLPTTKAFYSIPLGLDSLGAAANIFAIVKIAGDATDHFHLYGEASQDAAHPVWKRAGTSGAWSAENAAHYTTYSGIGISPVLKHVLYEKAHLSIYRSNGVWSELWACAEAEDGTIVIKDRLQLTLSGAYPVKGGLL